MYSIVSKDCVCVAGSDSFCHTPELEPVTLLHTDMTILICDRTALSYAKTTKCQN